MNLPYSGSKKTKNYYVRDIHKVEASLGPLVVPKKNPVQDPRKNFIIFYSPELPTICFCKSTKFKQTDKFSYSQTTEKFSGVYCTHCKRCFITTTMYEKLA